METINDASHPEGAPRAVRKVRPPFSDDFIACKCTAVDKDDCACIRVWLNALPSEA